MAYQPNSRSSPYGGQRRGSGIRGRFGRGKKENCNRDFSVQGLSQGSLRDYGWSATLPDEQRHDAIDMMVQTEGAEAAKLKLQTLFGATGQPYIDQVIQSDIQYIEAKAATSQQMES